MSARKRKAAGIQMLADDEGQEETNEEFAPDFNNQPLEMPKKYST